MNNNDERDFAEEADNLREMHCEDSPDIAEEMCQITSTVNVGYGPDEEMPCGSKAMFVVKYDLFIPYDPETGETDFWTECTETVCDGHRGQMVSYAEEHPAEMQITSVVHIPGTVLNSDMPDNEVSQYESDRADNMPDKDGPVEWYLWYENLNPDSRHR